MHKVVKEIIERKSKNEEKIKALNDLQEDIEIGRGIISGKFKYCPKCDDYYLAKSFGTDRETKEIKICVWDDPINSGGNEYVDGYADILYSVCPKGHKKEIDRTERKE